MEFATVPVVERPLPPHFGRPEGEGDLLLAPGSRLTQGELFTEFDTGREPCLVTSAAAPAEWTDAQERAMDEEVRIYAAWLGQAGSLEVSELVGRQLEGLVPEGISSPLGEEKQRPKEFWLDVNAELVIYGATEPNASVTFDGEPISLREDGTFSRRIAFPDGEYEVVVEAISVEGEARRARLRFRRCTEF